MPVHRLFPYYPDIIGEMCRCFTSHQFIRRLVQRHQADYVEALHHYQNSWGRQSAAPFRTVHGQLARHLHAFPLLVEYVKHDRSENTFGRVNRCAFWKKV